MPMFLRSALFGAVALLPAAAYAQGLFMLGADDDDDDALVIEEPALVAEEAAVVVEEPALVVQEAMAPGGGGAVSADEAGAIAMMHGIVTIEEVDERMWDGNFEVEGTDASGEDLEITIDRNTGAVLEVDD